MHTSIQIEKGFPSLSDNTLLRYVNFIALYLAQGIPEGMLLFGIPAWLAMNGKSPGEIAGFAVAFGLPWSFKFIVAPMMDRFTYLPMGRKRPWVLFGQLGLIVSFVSMAFIPDPLHNLKLLMMAVFAVGFFGAFQDVATDGMAIDIIPVNQQARANGFMWGSKIAGTAASLALGSWLLNQYSFSTAILVLSCGIGLIMLAPLLLRERPGEKVLPWTKGESSAENKKLQPDNWGAIFKSLYRVFSLRNSLLFAAIAFMTQGAVNFMDTLLPIFTVQHLGWTDQTYSNFNATATLVGGLGGMLVGGILIDKFGKMRMLNVYLALQIVFISTFFLMQSYWQNRAVISGYMVLYQILNTFTTIGIFATAMQCCWKKVSASQFTMFMTISNIGRIAGASLVGPLTNRFDWEYVVLSFGVLIAIAWLGIQFLNVDRQVSRIAEFERHDAEILSIPAMP
ncbi:MAG: MFS transporter [Flavobacterium sp.]|uniref:MFS transporter n=1 Tax=Flavobacterium sp. TaxID=239 RepID=UPI0012288810|nr:MFS transporter [Flavobacterium sp.]RZJ66005.1 MAG: MFS transporter [Flavobacterium sp.]